MRRLFRLWRMGGRDFRILWTALRDERRPAWLLPAAAALGFFALEPFNFAVPFLGVIDDVVLLPFLLRCLVLLIPKPARLDPKLPLHSLR